MPVTSPHVWYPSGTSGPAYDLRQVKSWYEASPSVNNRIFVRFGDASYGTLITVEFDKTAFEVALQASLDATTGGGGGGGGVGGSGVAGRVAYWSSNSNITSSGDLTYANSTLSTKYQQFPTNAANPDYAEGKVFYDNAEHALAYYSDVAGKPNHIGHELKTKCYNNTGSTIVKGSVVYISGAQGQRPTIGKARSDAKATSEVIGMVEADVLDGAYSDVITFGLITELNTSGFTVGQLVYLSATTAGALVSTIPASPARNVKVGIIVQSHPVNGAILVNPFVASSLAELNDVAHPITPMDEQALLYKAANSRWENRFLVPSDIKPVSTTIAYDGQNRVSVITTASGTKTISYNLDGTVASVVGTGSYKTKTMTYSGGLLTSITVS